MTSLQHWAEDRHQTTPVRFFLSLCYGGFLPGGEVSLLPPPAPKETTLHPKHHTSENRVHRIRLALKLWLELGYSEREMGAGLDADAATERRRSSIRDRDGEKDVRPRLSCAESVHQGYNNTGSRTSKRLDLLVSHRLRRR